ncbi:MAG TPA: glutamine--fructose-6-phosphate transaminase (isomerizing) [Chloroflexi bacterium]|nr:glutamine--fructose-6-phosphate transaminase (isomerizing) [Chloroflexota bacterium]
MCGIVGYIGDQNATEVILNGLHRLEYRGYDSAGIAVLENGSIALRRDVGKLNRLAELLKNSPIAGNVGIGHTRWATHGVPSERNAHPHLGNTGKVVVVHNGIVENFIALKAELLSEGAVFRSDTDTETIVLLVEKFLAEGMDLISAACATLKLLQGAHGVVLFSIDEPDKIITARMGNAGGVVIGIGEGETFIASDIPAILEHTRKMVFLETHQMAVVTKKGVDVMDLDGNPVDYTVSSVAWDPVSAEKGEYRHFMQKEIHEQVRSLTDTLAGRADFERGDIYLQELNLTREKAEAIGKIFITACGTAAHAGMVGKYLIEHLAKIPVEVEIASEFRYRDPIIAENSVVLAISQSGETADTLAAMTLGKEQGATLWSIVNAIGSQAMRISDGSISMQTGPEIGVASTKAFTAPLVDLYMLAIVLADAKGLLSSETKQTLITDLAKIPGLVGECLLREKDVEEVSKKIMNAENALYLGRGIQMPIAYEGALKLKEISYIHAEGYPAGEMKHGPIALLDDDLPVVAICPQDRWHDKMISQIEQAKARGAYVIAVAEDGDEKVALLADDVLWVPHTSWLLMPVLTVIPLQILAYQIAALRGLDVDQPRNLAKSVTVE